MITEKEKALINDAACAAMNKIVPKTRLAMATREDRAEMTRLLAMEIERLFLLCVEDE